MQQDLAWSYSSMACIVHGRFWVLHRLTSQHFSANMACSQSYQRDALITKFQSAIVCLLLLATI